MFHSIDIIRTDLIEFDNYLGLTYAEPWKKGISYVRGDFVKYREKKYICSIANGQTYTAGDEFDPTKFTLFDRDYESKGFWNAWEDWHLIPSSRPVFMSPKLRKRTVEIPGADGVLDLSDNFTNGPVYDNSEGSFEFIVDNDWESWTTINQKIMNVLHGRTVRCILEDDPGFYRVGRFTVNEWKSEEQNSKIVFDYSVSPYKYAITESDEDAYWDPIMFETDIIRDYKLITLSGGKVQYTRAYDSSTFTRDYLDFYSGRQFSTLKIHCNASSSLSLTIKQVTKNIFGVLEEKKVYPVDPEVASQALTAGTDYYPLDCGDEQRYRLYFSGSGSITIKYREGSL